MDNLELLILSIWQVDPVGGIFVDWPDDLDEGEVSAAKFRYLDTLPTSTASRLLRIESGVTDGWIAHDRLAALSDELDRLLAEFASSAAEHGERSAITVNLRKLAAAVTFARSIPDAGLYIS